MRKPILLLFFIFSITCLFGQWTQLNDAPFVNHHTNGFGINGKAYSIQGISEIVDGQEGNMLWEYDPQVDTWTALGLAPSIARGYAIGDDMDGKYYFGFGFDRRDVWEFDPETLEFTELPPCPGVTRGHPAFIAHNDKIFMGAGSGDAGNLNDWWVYDFATATWEQKANMPGERRHHPYQFAIDDAVYVGGGHRGNWIKWDINAETWTAIDDFPGSRVAGTQFSYNGKGFVLSGDLEDHTPLVEKNFLMYDPAGDEWYELPFESSMHRWAGSSFIIGDDLFYFGGFGANPGGNDLNMWKFDLTTVKCLAPTRVLTTEITDNTAGLFWSEGPSGATDHFQWREVGGAWTTVETSESLYTLENLEGCTDYEFRVHINCGADGDSYSEIESFTTTGCGACIDNDFCDLGVYSSLSAYLNSVSIDAYTNVSENNDGYGIFTNSNGVEIGKGGSFDLTYEPVISGFNQSHYMKVWIDSNADGEFGDEELILDELIETGDGATRTLQVSEDALEGLTRLRVILNLDDISSPCNNPGIQKGEVEDYCVTIVEGPTSIKTAFDLLSDQVSVFPNPFHDNIQIDLSNLENVESVSLENIHGVNMLSRTLDAKAKDQLILPTGQVPNGIYLLRLFATDGSQIASKKIVRN